MAIKFAKKGYNVVISCVHRAEQLEQTRREIESFQAPCLAYLGDMGDLKSCETLFSQIRSRFGGVDVLVNNAGISSEVYFLDATEEMFDHMTAVDWKGVYFSSQIAAKRMIEREIRGVIINIASNQVDGCWPRATESESAG